MLTREQKLRIGLGILLSLRAEAKGTTPEIEQKKLREEIAEIEYQEWLKQKQQPQIPPIEQTQEQEQQSRQEQA